jgi:hypothetical protein
MSESSNNRKYHLPITELIDRVTILEIKLVLDNKNSKDYLNEIELIKSDLEFELNKKQIILNTKIVQTLIALGQMNLHIWYIKDQMKLQQNDPLAYANNMKLAHQLNGLRNQLKNMLLVFEDKTTSSQIRSNTEMDGLEIDLGI